MTVSFAGPHHCMGVARAVSEALIAEFRLAAVQNNGVLTVRQIDDIRAAYNAKAQDRFRDIEVVFNSCMQAAAKESPPASFDQAGLLAMFLYAYTSRITRAVFHKRFDPLDKNWMMHFYRTFVRFIIQRYGCEFSSRALAVYAAAGSQKGQHLSVGELVHTEEGRAAVRDCLLRVIEEPATSSLATEFCIAINAANAVRYQSETHQQVYITLAEAERFFTLLRYAKPVHALIYHDTAAIDGGDMVFIDDIPDEPPHAAPELAISLP